jgi:23S rRNA A2030 N6-methylase RlmJ
MALIAPQSVSVGGKYHDPSYLRNWNYEPVVDEIAEAAVPLYADWCRIWSPIRLLWQISLAAYLSMKPVDTC